MFHSTIFPTRNKLDFVIIRIMALFSLCFLVSILFQLNNKLFVKKTFIGGV